MLNATFPVIFKHCAIHLRKYAFPALFKKSFQFSLTIFNPLKWRSVRTPMKNWTVSKSPKKGFTVHVLANRRSMGPRKKKTHWMANFLLEAKGYQNAASWKNGSAFRLDERRDDLVGQKPNVLCTNLTLHDFYSFSVGNPLNFLAKRKHANFHLTSSFGGFERRLFGPERLGF